MNLIQTFLNKPIIVEAIQFADDADTISNISGFLQLEEPLVIDYADKDNPVLKLQSDDGHELLLGVGDWLVQRSDGEIETQTDERFKLFYARITEQTVENTANALYSTYCEQVGGKAFNGDPLPSWEDFSADPSKQLQAEAWRTVAKQALNIN